MITKYTDLGSSTDLKVRENGYKSHAYVMDKVKQRSWECAPLLAKLIEFTTSNQNIFKKKNTDHNNVRLNPTHFFERLTKEGISTVGGNYRRVCKEYHQKYGSGPTQFEKDVHIMISFEDGEEYNYR